MTISRASRPEPQPAVRPCGSRSRKQLLCAVVLAAGCTTSTGTGPAGRSDGTWHQTALTVLHELPVKGRAPKTGYGRDRFGPDWTDDSSAPEGHNGCDTRNDILAAQLDHVQRPDGCRVVAGDLIDPYTGVDVHFLVGESSVDIDHVVSLSDAWQKGAQQLRPEARVRLANDPLNLLAVSASANRQKGDGDAATWLPKAKPYRCAFVARQVAVKRRYALWVTAAERDAIRRVLAMCPDEPVPTG